MTERLRRAVQGETAPPDLAVRIRHKLDEASPAGRRVSWWAQPWPAIAAVVAISIGAGIAYQRGHLRFTDGQRESFMVSLMERVSSAMRPGLDDHLHCSVYGKVPKDSPPLAEAVKGLAPQYTGLLEAVQRHMPENFRLYSAHECRQHGRNFIHFQLKTDSKLVSVIVTRRGDDESFVRDRIAPALAAAGTPVYEASAVHYELAAIESGDYLAYVVSDLSRDQNTRLMQAMASDVAAQLANLRT